jgi:two-component system LytT family response regulator
MRIRTLIADDEPIARERLRALVGADRELELIGEAHDGPSALEAIVSRAPELVLLDVQMPRLDGFAVLESLPPERLPVVVFVTAYDEHALRAFEVHALDFLLKPFDEARFRRALARAKDRIAKQRPASVDRRLDALLESFRRSRGLERLAVQSGGRVFLLRTEDVDWFAAAGNYVRAHVRGELHLLRRSLSSLEEELDAARFVRIHRSLLVNLERVVALEPARHGAFVVVLRDGTRLTTSRAHGARLQRRLSRR